MTLKVKLIIFLLLSTTPIFAQQSKKEVLKSINFWYDNHSSKYIISIYLCPKRALMQHIKSINKTIRSTVY